MTDIVKDLPEVFEEFADQRKNAFLEVKELKDKGIPLVGAYCTYFPEEVAWAAGASTVGLCATSDETIPEAEKDLPANLCPLIKSSYGFAKTDKCPFFYFSDVVVGETTCDGKKKMYELMNDIKPMYIMHLPQNQTEKALRYWKDEVVEFRNYLEDKLDTKITDESLLEWAKVGNDIRDAQKNLADTMELDPAPMSGLDFFHVTYGSQFKMDKTKVADEINAIAQKIRDEYDSSKLEKKPRIIVTGCPMGGATEKVIKAIEDNGAVVVSFENCSGEKNFDNNIDLKTDDINEAIARRYLDIGCSVMTPDTNRYDLLGRLIDKYDADGVIEMDLVACHPYIVEREKIKRFVTEEKGIPYMFVETDFSKADIGQLNTRMAAFVEML